MNKKFIGLTASLALFLAACGSEGATKESTIGTTTEPVEVSVGIVSEAAAEVWRGVKDRLVDEGIDLKIEEFTDYVQPNLALQSGDIDLNAFQHVAFLDSFNSDNDGDLTPIGFTFVSPLGLYSEQVKDYADLPDGAEIAIPNDVTNGGRALLLLQAIDLITLDEAAGTSATVSDIIENPKNLVITEIDAAQTARTLPDVAAAIINTNFATDSGLIPSEDALFLDTDNIDDVNEIYKNVIATRAADAKNEVYLKIVKAYQTEETAAKIAEVTAGNDIPAW